MMRGLEFCNFVRQEQCQRERLHKVLYRIGNSKPVAAAKIITMITNDYWNDNQNEIESAIALLILCTHSEKLLEA